MCTFWRCGACKVCSPPPPPPDMNRTLVVITPSFRGHLQYWRLFVESIVHSPKAGGCNTFGIVSHHTIVTDDREQRVFTAALDKIIPVPRWLQVSTLHDAIRRSADASLGAPAFQQWLGRVRNKFWLQSIKKLHGCLAYTPIDGVCFAVDSDSFLLRHSLCHAAEAYMLHDQKTVLMSTHRFAPDCGQREFVEASRAVLGRPRGEQFGEGYMMSVYHWLWDVADLRTFVRDGLRERTALLQLAESDNTSELHFSVEEAFYHFVYPRAAEMGYRFVPIESALRDVVGVSLWDRMRRDANPLVRCDSLEEWFMFLSAPGSSAEVDEPTAQRMGQWLVDNGILMARCPCQETQPPPKSNYSVVMARLDLCTSSGQHAKGACMTRR